MGFLLSTAFCSPLCRKLNTFKRKMLKANVKKIALYKKAGRVEECLVCFVDIHPVSHDWIFFKICLIIVLRW